jgi:uncharacterized protein
MRTVFADTSYWIALISRVDNLHQRAVAVSAQLGQFQTITSDMVLAEVLNFFASRGSQLRGAAIHMTNIITTGANMEVVPQTRQLFRRAYVLYQKRQDKTWSLTDCASFVIMDQKQIVEALTHDHHFEQVGYKALLR